MKAQRGEQRYSSSLSLTSALDGGWWPTPCPDSPEKTRYSWNRRLGESEGRFGRVRKISPSPGFDPRIAQSVV